MSESKVDSQEKATGPTLEEQINTALQNVDDKGKVIFEDNVDPVFKAAVKASESARFFQGDNTKMRQERAKLQAENRVLMEKATSSVGLSTEQIEELEDLKFTDPDAWFSKKTQYEADANAAATGKLEEQLGEASSKALQDLTLSQRQEALKDFELRTGIELTDDVMANDIPPRLQAKMETMPFEDYLAEVSTYLGKGKKIQDEEVLKQEKISDLAGSSMSKKAAKEKPTIL